ncbi:Intracellular distribution of mitochondria, partial [Coemansia aciculifera]
MSAENTVTAADAAAANEGIVEEPSSNPPQEAQEEINGVQGETEEEEEEEEEPYRLTIKAPNGSVVPVLASSQETVQELKQVVSETASTVEYSCFYLALHGQRLNDYALLSEIEGLALDSTLELVEDEYTEREARIHVIRLRELVSDSSAVANALVAGLDAGVSIYGTVRGEVEGEGDAASHAFKGYELGQAASLDVLSPAKALKQMGLPACIRSLALSGWNPVPRHRQMQGDLLYLLVTTLENQSYHITAHRDGFFVNASTQTRFNGSPAAHSNEKTDHSLVTLLRRLSPGFTKGLEAVQRALAARDPVSTLPFAVAEQAAAGWAVRGPESRTPAYDVGGPQDAFLRSGGVNSAADSLRDWNEELQSIRELPRTTLQERVVRDRQLHRWHGEFVEAAVAGAIAVVGGELVALNPTDSEEQHMFLRDNIFYSKGFDGREAFGDLGGDAAAHVATGKDITGVRLVNHLDPSGGLHTLGSVVVDYCGVRVVAQSVVPGVFRRQEVTPIVYGSSDQGKTLAADP